ncbi:chromosome partitioning protein ParB [Afipia sp. P52-10]|jgi:ParB family chromosome partitioning protein|uniref:ParB/RepB/Spo0J family partition protein n=1 Tax=Afipia sp. P52-10 TaxID=1429916 RepID=UPI0003DF168D|nr:ParB/RepB/Spo0J family partition protein [Afipia sp. P52-10]ETR77795.1 chromosome partitioning protein ParB [Afipia sp. P52-10]
MADEARSRLGRGLASLIGDVGGEAAKAERARAQRRVPIEFLKPNPRNPRKTFADGELAELAESIRQHGVIQPIVVRPVRGVTDSFEIIAGERRWRAAQRAGLHDVPVVPIEVSDTDALEIMIIENIQREDLNAMEEARGYHALADEFKRSADEIAKVVGKSRSHVANMMRLTKLPQDVQEHIAAGRLSAGHARALIGVSDPSQAAQRVIDGQLSVRETEALAHEAGVPVRKPSVAKAVKKDADTLALEKRISDVLGLKVSVEHKDPGGTVRIRYRDLDQLDDILKRLDS